MTRVESSSPQAASQSQSPDGDPSPGQDERRGSHATTRGQGFGWLLTWTILGTLVPGTGLIAAGWRRLGIALLILVGLAGVGLAGFVALGNLTLEGLSLAVDPQKLLLLAVSCAAMAVLWAAVVVLSHTQLRRYADLNPRQGAFSSLVVLALLAAIALPAYKVSSYAWITRSVITSKSVFQDDGGQAVARPKVAQADPWAGTPRVNVLLIGSDAGADRTGIRPDTMILASINTKTGNTVLFSLPRNLQHARFAPGTPGATAWPEPDGFYCPQIPPGDTCLLNAIWTWASSGSGLEYYRHSKHPGLQATRDAIEGVTGLKVDTYVMLNLNGFRSFVDAIGGLTVNITERLPIGGNSEHPVATGGYLEPGRDQHLDGYHALWFARSRWASTDYDRMQRQRCAIGDFIDQADPVKLAKGFPALASALKSNLSTGIATADLSAWVQLSLRVKNAKVTSLPFTDQVISTVHPDFDQIQALVQQALATSDEPKADRTKAATTPPASPSAPETKPVKINHQKAQDVKTIC